jgi:hypothetical protein
MEVFASASESEHLEEDVGTSVEHRTVTPSLLTRRSFAGLAGAAAAGMLLYAGEVSRHELMTERRTIAIQNLPESFAGFRIAQISDFHYAAYTEPSYIERVVARVNALKPDDRRFRQHVADRQGQSGGLCTVMRRDPRQT